MVTVEGSKNLTRGLLKLYLRRIDSVDSLICLERNKSVGSEHPSDIKRYSYVDLLQAKRVLLLELLGISGDDWDASELRRLIAEKKLKCPKCNGDVWDLATVDQRLNKCWDCGVRFDNEEGG